MNRSMPASAARPPAALLWRMRQMTAPDVSMVVISILISTQKHHIGHGESLVCNMV